MPKRTELSEEQLAQFAVDRANRWPITELCKKYKIGVDRATNYCDSLPKPKRTRSIAPEVVAAIRKDRATTMTAKEIGIKYNVSSQTVLNYTKGMLPAKRPTKSRKKVQRKTPPTTCLWDKQVIANRSRNL